MNCQNQDVLYLCLGIFVVALGYVLRIFYNSTKT
jgi:hypothetical protein